MNEYQIREALNNFIINANVDPDSDLFKQAVQAVNELDHHRLVDNRDTIALLWCVDDVLEIRPDLNQDQASEVLMMVEDKHDAGIGVNWDTLQIWADYLYPEEDSE